MKNWLGQHAFALAEAWRHIRKPRGGFLLNVLVIAIALALPFAGLTVLENVQPVSKQLSVEPEISIFVAMDTPRDKAVALAAGIRAILQSAGSKGGIEFVAREKALAALKDKTELSATLAALGSNPLPDSYVVKLTGLQGSGVAADMEAMVRQMKTLPGVDYVQLDSAWVKRLAALLHVLQMALLLLASLLGMVVVAVVFNTIRLQVLSQREEIDLCRLVGATDGFIYRPFYYNGAILGLCAGMLAIGAVTLALQPLNDAIADLARLYASQFMLVPLSIPAMLLLLATSTVLGLLGALLSVRRYLTRSA